MSKVLGNITKFSGGISCSEKEGQENSFRHGRAINFRSDARKLTINPKSEKDSGGIVTDLVKWAERVEDESAIYFYGDAGNIYQKNSSGTWSLIHTAADSSGNGMSYFGEDGYLYYTQDKTFGRYGPTDGTAEWYDNFLAAEGGDPTNTHSLDLESGSSHYAYRADTASLSITGDLSLGGWFKFESLPSSGNTMTLIGKWDESGTTRSYKMDVGTISNFFGDGSDGALTISTDTTEAPTDSACTGTINTQSLTATNASFAAGDKIMIHQTRGTNAGTYELNDIQAYTAGTITTKTPLKATYTSGAQVRVLKEYTDVTINSGKTYTAKAWNGTVGGILAFYASGTVTITGNIEASEKGFRGGQAVTSVGGSDVEGYCGEGTGGASTSGQQTSNGNGGGGGNYVSASGDAFGGAAGGHAREGNDSGADEQPAPPEPIEGGLASGSENLTTMTFGGGGGSGSAISGSYSSGSGGNGGGIVAIFGKTIAAITGSIKVNGEDGETANTGSGQGGGGAGAAGTVLIKCQTAALGTQKIEAHGGQKGSGSAVSGASGSKSEGRIHVDYLTSVSGTTYNLRDSTYGFIDPAYTSSQDDSLGSTVGYSLRLLVSDDGDTAETHTMQADLVTDTWTHLFITWDASAAQSTFYKDGVSLGTYTGTMTEIDDNASIFYVGADENDGGSAANFFDGKMDSLVVFNDVRTASEVTNHKEYVYYGTESNMVAYYKFDNDATDSQTDGNNDLTLANSPTYSTDVPFSGVTTRADQDQALDTSGNTYTLTTAINEAATHRQTFVPAKDPQKSIEVNIAAKGTGDWTLTVHDALNRTIATKTITNAELHTGLYEFEFSTPWRPVIGASYHFHLTSTVADGTVVSTDSGDLETGEFFSHYQYLVTDTEWHPITQMLNFMVIGNERYVAKWAGTASANYEPHKLTLPSGYKVRCFAHWREYLAIGTWRGDSITDFDQGKIFFWDGILDTYNFYIDVPEGGVSAMIGTKGLLYIWAGYSGYMLLYQGGDRAEKIKRIPDIAEDDSLEMYPGAVNMWKSLVTFGVAGDSDSTTVHRGVYTWGSLNRNYEDALGFDYPLSLGDQTTSNVDVSCVFPSGQDLYIAWRSGANYGVDIISADNNPYSTATYESLIIDFDKISQSKYPLVLRADFEALASGETITLKYKNDRTHNWKFSPVEDTDGATEARMIIKEKVKEFQFGVDMATSGSTTPTVTGISLESETARDERLA